MSACTGPGEVLVVSFYELGHQPLGLAWPLSYLRQAGFSPAALDLAAEPYDPERVHRARVILCAVPMHTALRLGVRFVRRARADNPQARIGLFGLYAHLCADTLLRPAVGADAVLAGEAEAALVEFCRGQVPARTAPVLRRLPFVVPDRQGLPPLSRYARFDPGDGGAARTAGYTEASRGCRHLCRHCPIPPVYGGRFFAVPVDVVLADIAQQVAAGARHITFGDPDFLNGPGHALRVLRAVHAAFPDLTCDITAKIEHILRHRAVWPEFAALGCRFVISAVESLSPLVLRLLDKGHTPADVPLALAVLRGAGIALRPSLVPFTPWSTLSDYLALFDFLIGHDLVEHIDPVQLTIRLLVPPGSRMLDLPELLPHLGPLDESGLSYRWRHPDPRMDRLQEDAARLVEQAAGGPGPDTLARLHALARQAAGETAPARALVAADMTRSRAPRLTEPWFC